MLTLIRDGIAINPHYRKLTPMVADALASWGDWKNAIWIWESVLQSRPNVVVVMTNIARGYLQIGNPEKAREYLERAKRVQPIAVAVNSLEVTYLNQTGRSSEAAQTGSWYKRPMVWVRACTDRILRCLPWRRELRLAPHVPSTVG